jgi:hypothetical protein
LSAHRTTSGRLLGGALLAVTACASSGPTRSGESLGPIVWNGIDTRPLAVDSELRITFTSPDPAVCCGSGYEVQSLAPEIVSVQDLGGQQISLKGLAPGFAEVQVLSLSEVVGRLGVAVRTPTQIALSDPSHLAAGIDVPLPPGFAVRSTGLELITIQVLDDSKQPLTFSSTLLSINSSGPIQVAGQGAETLAVVGQESGQQGCFDVELASGASSDTPPVFSCAVAAHNGWHVYQVSVVEAPASVTLSTRPIVSSTEEAFTALAIALGADGILEVLGAEPWSFSLTGQGTLVPIAPAATKVIFAAGTPPKATTLFVAAPPVSTYIAVPP